MKIGAHHRPTANCVVPVPIAHPAPELETHQPDCAQCGVGPLTRPPHVKSARGEKQESGITHSSDCFTESRRSVLPPRKRCHSIIVCMNSRTPLAPRLRTAPV